MKRKMVTLLLALTMAGSLVACGGDPAGDVKDGDAAVKVDAGEENEASGGGSETPEEGGEPVTLTIWIQSVNEPEYFQWVKETFESQNRDIKLKIEPQATTVLGDTLDVTLGGEDAPDIVATWGGLVASKLYAGNRILAIDDIITDEVEADFVEAATYNKLDGNGTYVSLPLYGFVSPVIYYNKTAFDELGLKAPTTYEELKEVSGQIRNASKQPLIAGFSTWHMPHFMQAIHARTMAPEDFGKLIGTPADFNPYELPIRKDVDISGANPILADVVSAMNEKGVSGFYQSYSATGIDVEILNAGSSLLTGSCDSDGAAKMIVDYYRSNIME